MDEGEATQGRLLGRVVWLAVLLLAPVLVALLALAWAIGQIGEDVAAADADLDLSADAAVHRLEDGGIWAAWLLNLDGSPVRWNACEPIRWVVNPQDAPAGALDDLHAAFDRVATATGLTFSFEGSTDEAPRAGRATLQTTPDGDRWSPVLVAFTEPSGTDIPLRTTDRAVTVPVAVGRRGDRTIVTAQMVFRPSSLTESGFADRGTGTGAVMLHELGHLVGLAHVEVPTELMYAHPAPGPVAWGPGDTAGLAAVGLASGCRTTPAAADLDVAITRGS